jgi:NADH:ubiquinone oxidoreductase subunit K
MRSISNFLTSRWGPILTGIVVAVSVTALALSMVILLYRQYGTLDVDNLMRDKEPSTTETGDTIKEEGETS